MKPVAVAKAVNEAVDRKLGAAHVGLVAPYLAYMRQDRRFKPGGGRNLASGGSVSIRRFRLAGHR